MQKPNKRKPLAVNLPVNAQSARTSIAPLRFPGEGYSLLIDGGTLTALEYLAHFLPEQVAQADNERLAALKRGLGEQVAKCRQHDPALPPYFVQFLTEDERAQRSAALNQGTRARSDGLVGPA